MILGLNHATRERADSFRRNRNRPIALIALLIIVCSI